MSAGLLGIGLALSSAAQESRPEGARLRVEELPRGVRVKAKAAPGDGGGFRGDDLELLPSGSRDAVTGPVGSISRERFTVAGVRVEATAETVGADGRRFDPSSLVEGAWVKVDGRLGESGRVRARRVRPEAPRERATIEGRVESIEPAGAGWRVRILALDLVVPPRARVEVPPSLAGVSLETLTEEPPSRRRRTDDDYVPGTIRLGEHATVGGTITARVDHENELDLDPTDDEDRTRFPLRVRLEATARPSDRVFLVAGLEQERSWRLEDGAPNGRDRRTNLRETFVFLRDPLARGVDLEAGRLHFKDDRQWLYDRDLDGVRLSFDRSPWHAELSATTVAFGGRNERDEETTNAIATLSLDLPDRGNLTAFLVHREQRGRGEEDSPRLAGVQARVRPAEGVRGWTDAAIAWGTDRDERIRGYAIDAGATLVLPISLEPSITAACAYGSGGDRDPGDGSRDFRQTGLQDNSGRWNGVTTFSLYGELLDPELSNLSIATLGLGVRPFRRTSLDLVAHRYAQVRAAPFLRDAEIDAAPDGSHRDLGWELDAVFGWREVRNLDLEIVAARFHPGDAFPGAPVATFLKFELRFKF